MYYNINEIFQRMVDYLYEELGAIAMLEDMHHDIKLRYNYDIDEWYITRNMVIEWLDNQGLDVTEEAINFLIFG